MKVEIFLPRKFKSAFVFLPYFCLKKMIRFDLCVVRHGETMENRKNIYQGQLDTVLSDVGIKQIKLVAKSLQDETFTHAVSSDLQRAYKTGECVLNTNNHSNGLVLVKDQRIRERNYGEFEGKTEVEVREIVKKHNAVFKNYVPEGGETLQQLKERAVEFFDDLCKKLVQATENGSSVNDVGESLECRVKNVSSLPSAANVLVTCHGGSIKQLVSHLAKDIPSEFLCSLGKDEIGKVTCPNTGVSRFEVFVSKTTKKAEFIRCMMIYDASHLINEEETLLKDDECAL